MLTYVDSSTLLSAWRGPAARQMRALTILNEPHRVFVCSPYVQIELLPKAIFYKQHAEAEFYQAYFQSVQRWVTDCESITKNGFEVASKFGMAAMDAMHIAAALNAKIEEFVTAERATSPFSRVQGLRVVSVN